MGISWQKLCHTLFCNGVVQRTFYKNASAGWPLIFQPGSIFVQQIPYVSTIGAFYSSCWGTPNQEKKNEKGGAKTVKKRRRTVLTEDFWHVRKYCRHCRKISTRWMPVDLCIHSRLQLMATQAQVLPWRPQKGSSRPTVAMENQWNPGNPLKMVVFYGSS